MSATEVPAVVVLVAGPVEVAVLREVRAGAEEEGVPTSVVAHDGPDQHADATALAHTGALRSPLDTGIGLDAAGGVAVHHATLPLDRPVRVLTPGADPAHLRLAGRTAARIVKVLPL
ncbi:MAG: glycerol dehydratase reactivase beta/small subunit family protein [Pseudonocardia sp.]|nr:glycerol dehydratase reactivase beta/small subunit family protein [Pseudonocardia sp.]